MSIHANSRWFDRRRGRRHGPRRGRHGDGAGPSGTQAESPAPLVMPEARPLPSWILAGPAAPNLYADEELEPADQEMDIDPALAAPSPPPRCPIHGLACPRLVPAALVEEEAEPMAPAAPSPQGSLDLPSPTPAHELVYAGTAPSSSGLGLRLPAPAPALGDVFENGAGSSTAAAPPPRRRIRFLIRTGHRPTEGNGLSNGHSNGVTPGTHLPGGSSSEDEDGAPGASAPRR
jgi:hypothetical protein